MVHRNLDAPEGVLVEEDMVTDWVEERAVVRARVRVARVVGKAVVKAMGALVVVALEVMMAAGITVEG